MPKRRQPVSRTTHQNGAVEAVREDSPPYRVNGTPSEKKLRFIDLFCGIGGFRLAFERAGARCVFSSDWDKFSRQTYAANFGETPHGDIHSVAVADIPKFDILCGGFPYQPFSLAGVSKKNSLGRKHGFADVNRQSIEGIPQRTRNSAVASSKAGLRVASAESPCGTQTTKPCRARVSRTRYLFSKYCLSLTSR